MNNIFIDTILFISLKVMPKKYDYIRKKIIDVLDDEYELKHLLLSHYIFTLMNVSDVIINMKPEMFYKVQILLPIGIINKYINKNIKLLDKLTDNMRRSSLNNIESLRKVTEKFNIILNENDLEIACRNEDPVVIEYILQHKIIPTSKYFKMINDHIDTITNVFINYGYQLDHEDIIKLCKIKYTIPEYEKYDVKVDNEIFMTCCDAKFMPDYVKKFKPTKEEFYEIFKSRINIVGIKKYIKMSGCKLDSKCLENACEVHNYNKIINYLLIDREISSNLVCIKKYINTNLIGESNYKIALLDEIEKNINLLHQHYYKEYLEEMGKKYDFTITEKDEKIIKYFTALCENCFHDLNKRNESYIDHNKIEILQNLLTNYKKNDN
jgi:hypothetical protein